MASQAGLDAMKQLSRYISTLGPAADTPEAKLQTEIVSQLERAISQQELLGQHSQAASGDLPRRLLHPAPSGGERD